MDLTATFKRGVAAVAVILATTLGAAAQDLVEFNGVTAQGGPTAQVFPSSSPSRRVFTRRKGSM
jgi:hypothetical protein